MQEHKSWTFLGVVSILTQCKMNRNRHKRMFFSCHLKILSQVMSNLHSPNALCDDPALKMQ